MHKSIATTVISVMLPISPLSAATRDTKTPTSQTLVNVLDLKTLGQLEANGYSLNQILVQTEAESNASELYSKNSLYRNLADTIGRHLAHDPKTDQLPTVIPPNSGDIPDMVRSLRGFEDKGSRSEKDTKSGFKIQKLANNSSYPYLVEQDGDEPRHFDERWLWSKFASFKLIGVINRMDRADITKDSCGEVRFIYRLSYKSPVSASSLPFFLNAVEEYPKQKSCQSFAKLWQSGDLRKALAPLVFKQIESNFQSLRFTSGYMHDFGGQAMYMQRIFRKLGTTLAPVPLENTPDVDELKKNPIRLTEFAEYLKRPENLRAIDDGTINIDSKYLTKLSISWSTLGRAREANRPFGQLFHDNPKLLSGVVFQKMSYVKSTEGLIERLNSLSCMGCHQTGGTAGFHMLGISDPSFSHPFNRQQVPLSPHAQAEVPRREAWVSALAAGREPNHFRPHSSAPRADWSPSNPTYEKQKVGELCLIGDDFANHATCGDSKGGEVSCQKTVGGAHVLLGECVLQSPSAGAICWRGKIEEEQKGLFAFTDKFKLEGAVLEKNGDYKCVLPQSGAPLGRMSRRCTLKEENFDVDFSNGIPNELCANQGGQGFDMCAASGDSGACLETKVARSMLDTCSNERSCREDYICQAFPDYQKISKADYVRKKNGELINITTPDKINGVAISRAQELGVGFCVPTYFLFNMRADGHPSPVTGLAPGAPKTDHSLPVRGYKR